MSFTQFSVFAVSMVTDRLTVTKLTFARQLSQRTAVPNLTEVQSLLLGRRQMDRRMRVSIESVILYLFRSQRLHIRRRHIRMVSVTAVCDIRAREAAIFRANSGHSASYNAAPFAGMRKTGNTNSLCVSAHALHVSRFILISSL